MKEFMMGRSSKQPLIKDSCTGATGKGHKKMNIYEKLSTVQVKLKAPKTQHNHFGNFNYRSCEDILEALKPLLHEVGAVVTISDQIVNIGNRFYVQATAIFSDLESDATIQTAAFAREPESRPKMDDAQATGSSSSYARKYALNGLFCIDDAKDPDFTNDGQQNKENQNKGKQTKPTASGKVQREHINTIRAEIERTGAMEKAVCYQYKIKRLEDMTMQQFKNAMEIFKSMKDKPPAMPQYAVQGQGMEQYAEEMPFR